MMAIEQKSCLVKKPKNIRNSEMYATKILFPKKYARTLLICKKQVNSLGESEYLTKPSTSPEATKFL